MKKKQIEKPVAKPMRKVLTCPIQPHPPVLPIKPKEFYEEIRYSSPKNEESVSALLQRLNVSSDDVFFKIDSWDYGNNVLNVCCKKRVVNTRYRLEFKQYEAAVRKHPELMKRYEKELAIYHKDMEAFEIYVAKRQYNRSKRRLTKLGISK